MMPEPIKKQDVPQNLVKQIADVQKLSAEDTSFALDYLNYYCQNPADGPLSEESVAEHVKSIQMMLNLPADGQLNSQVVKVMQHAPRCGVPDFIKMGVGEAADKWGTKDLKFYIEKYVNGLSRADCDSIIKLAFQQWSDVADLKFSQVGSQTGAHLVLSTGSGNRDNFDGPGNTLAWAYLPPSNNYLGQLLMRFDLDETWIKNGGDRGILLLNVACHEFGHMLGLDHSRSQGALMAPYYATAITKPQANDDVSRIQGLYGKPRITPGPTPPPTPGRHKIEVSVSNLSDIKIDGKPVLDFSLVTE